MRMRVRSLALLSGLKIWHCYKLWHRLQMRLGPYVAVAVVWAGSCHSDSAPSLGTADVALKRKKEKKKKKKKKCHSPLLKCGLNLGTLTNGMWPVWWFSASESNSEKTSAFLLALSWITGSGRTLLPCCKQLLGEAHWLGMETSHSEELGSPANSMGLSILDVDPPHPQPEASNDGSPCGYLDCNLMGHSSQNHPSGHYQSPGPQNL